MPKDAPIEDVLRSYAELKEAEKKIAASLEEIKPRIKEHLAKEGVDKLPTTVGTFTLSERATWKYSEAVDKLKQKEEATGVAKKVVSTSLIFTPPKEE
jgi:hypothetical protein